MAKTFTPFTYVVVTKGAYTEYVTEWGARNALALLPEWGVLLSILANGKPIALETRGIDTGAALGILARYR